MSRRFGLYLGVVALAIGFVVALAPMATGHGGVCIDGTMAVPHGSGGCTAATNNPDWIAGSLVAVAAYILLVGLILSARALRANQPEG
jgi:hypothetical protein